jgi:dTDP-3-amino-3,4,6-trideoxy-alpha-D-glucose transaminase
VAIAVSPTVPLTRLDNAEPELLHELLDCAADVARAGAFTLGEHVAAFERDFAAYCQVPHAIGVSSGTEALALSLRALRIGPGDEVIVPANSFIATAEAVSAVGATPLLIDVDPASHLIDARNLAAALNPRVRCVIPVHLYGATVELDPILALAHEAGIHVVEDACQAHGAFYRGRRAGTLGTLGCFSFYPTKNLGGWGDGGAVVTSDAQLAERVQLLRSHGERPRHHHHTVGATARLHALQAAILRHKLPRLDDRNAERRRLGATLRQRLRAGLRDTLGDRQGAGSRMQWERGTDGEVVSGGDGVVHGGGWMVPGVEDRAVELMGLPFPGADHVHHLFVVRSPAREQLRAHLAEHGIASAVHYPTPIHLTQAYAHLGLRPGSLPVCEALAQRICSLPLFPGMTDIELERVAAAVISFAAEQPCAANTSAQERPGSSR